MLSGKAAAATRPTALGSLLQASTYGMTIPNVIGVTQSPLLAIWAGNLRQGGSVKKFKQLKKGVTAYVENIDFLLGHNPIRGVLQMWANGSLYPLNYVAQSISAAPGRGTYAVSDSHFYAIVAVSVGASYSPVFNDFGGTGSQSPTGNYQIPMWNELETGPDPTDPMSYRCWPYCYRWQPSYGTSFYIDAESFPGGNLIVYYAQLTAATSFQPPSTKLRLAFEPRLGSGTEYADANLPDQQISYPMFAGLGSSNIDLGSAGVIPQLQAEVQAKWSLYSAGDADFADMIEDVVKSGLAQAAFGDPTIPNSQVEHGLSGYDLPGTIQKKIDQSQTAGLPPMLYDLPNVPGNILVCQVAGPGTMTISSTNGEIWTPQLGDGLGYQVWTAIAIGGLNTVTVLDGAGPWNMAIYEIGGVGGVDTAGIATGGLPEMFATMLFGTNPLTGGDYAYAGMGGFSSPTLPSDAVITAIYPVLRGSASSGGDFFSGYGVVTPPATGTSFGITAGASGQFAGGTIGTSLSALAGMIIGIAIAQSNGFDVAGTIQGNPAFAIYYTSATPTIENLSPLTPPVPVAAGHGLSWSLPTIGTVLAPDLYHGIDPPDHSPEYWIANGYAQVIFPVGGSLIIGPGIDSTTHLPSAPTYAGSGTITGSGGGGGGGGNTVTSTGGLGFDGFIMSLPWYSSGAPSAMEVPIYKLLTPPNLFGGTPANIQAHGRIVHFPGTYSIVEPGSPTIQVMLSFFSSEPASYPRPVYDFMDFQSLNCVRNQCRANGLWGSLSMNSQQAASDWLQMLYDAADAAPVFMGFKLFSVPYSEVSAVGNGAIYFAPTACGPLADLTTENGDFLAQSNAAPITVKTAARVDQPNVLQMQIINRNSNYNPSVVTQPDAAGISLFGVRKADPVVNNAVQDVTIARQLLGIQVRKLQYGGDVYSFTLPAKWALLSPMDLVTVTDPLADINQIPVRITSMVEQNDGSIACEAEPFIYGMYAPNVFVTDSPTPYVPNPNQPVGSGGGGSGGGGGGGGGTPPGNGITGINPPIIFEATQRLAMQASPAQIWIVVSCQGTNYGGCIPYISTDGGMSYSPATTSQIVGSSAQGALIGDLLAVNDPDTVDDVTVSFVVTDPVNPSASLPSLSAQQRDAFQFPCYIGTSPVSIVEANFTAGDTSQITAVGALFSNPTAPVLPSDAVITGIFPVILVDTFPADPTATTRANYGTGLTPTSGGTSFCSRTGVLNPPFYTYGVAGIGTSLSGQEMNYVLGLATDGGAPTSGTTRGIGWAVLYSSATPSVDPTILPPFGAPPGFGWAWAFPQTVTLGTVGTGSNATIVAAATGVPPGPIPYEIITYNSAAMIGPNTFTIYGTGAGNEIRRGVYGAPSPGVGMNHPATTPFALLSPDGTGIAKINMDPAWIGVQLWFKFPTFNSVGGSLQPLDNAEAYSFIPTGLPGNNSGPSSGFLVNGQ